MDSCYAITQFDDDGVNKRGLAGYIGYMSNLSNEVSQNFSVSNLPLYGTYYFENSMDEPAKTSFWDSNISDTNPFLESWAVGKIKIKQNPPLWMQVGTLTIPGLCPKWIPHLRWQVPNNPHKPQSHGSLAFSENQPVGTIVGEFKAPSRGWGDYLPLSKRRKQ